MPSTDGDAPPCVLVSSGPPTCKRRAVNVFARHALHRSRAGRHRSRDATTSTSAGDSERRDARDEPSGREAEVWHRACTAAAVTARRWARNDSRFVARHGRSYRPRVAPR
jgi:hypothetical protein